jgi:hypothetical protein
MTMMILQIVPFFGEFTIAYIYVRKRFGWEVDEYSQYSSIVSAIGIVGKLRSNQKTKFTQIVKIKNLL